MSGLLTCGGAAAAPTPTTTPTVAVTGPAPSLDATLYWVKASADLTITSNPSAPAPTGLAVGFNGAAHRTYLKAPPELLTAIAGRMVVNA